MWLDMLIACAVVGVLCLVGIVLGGRS